jgi:cytolysin (calcineurin-like family phosphatase)
MMRIRIWNWIVSAIALLIVIGILHTAFGRDVTFFVAADLHYGQDQAQDNEQGNKNAIAMMNSLPGTAFPDSGFGKVTAPRGVLVAGDLTNNGTGIQYDGYSSGKHLFDGLIDDYPVKDGTGAHLHWPVYEGYGNHDVREQIGDAVLKGIIQRNACRATPVNTSPNGLHYSWDWDDVHFVNLNVYPGGPGDARDSLSFLQTDLADRVGLSARPVILVQHYGFDQGCTSKYKGKYWWTQAERDALCNVIKGYNIVAIFTGHSHKSLRFPWNGIPDFVTPKAKGDNNTDGVYVVRILDDKMIVAQRRLNNTWANVWKETIKMPILLAPLNSP